MRANGICNTFGRGATVISPFVVGFLMVNYELPGVIWLMTGLLVVQIVAVYFWGVEPAFFGGSRSQGRGDGGVNCHRIERRLASLRKKPLSVLERQPDILLGKRCLGVFRGVQIVELIKPHLFFERRLMRETMQQHRQPP